MNELFAYFHSLRIELSYTTFMKRSHLCRSCKCSSTYTTDISFYFFTIDMYIYLSYTFQIEICFTALQVFYILNSATLL